MTSEAESPSSRVDEFKMIKASCVSSVKPDTQPGLSEDNTKMIKSSFTPEVYSESAHIFYRFKCPGSGLFQCSLTGLAFDVSQEAELLYRIIQWDQSILQSNGKTAAGPLFDIKGCEDAVHQLHFPHCETAEALLSDSSLSVIHFSDDGMNILEPLKITDTHVIVELPHFSALGLVWDFLKRFWNNTTPVRAQVLLFLRKVELEKYLDVFLLPSNIPLPEVKAQHPGSYNITVASNCKLIKEQTYTVHFQTDETIQPKRAEFPVEFGPNYFPTYVIRLPINMKEFTLTIQDQTDNEVWEHEVYVTDVQSRDNQPRLQSLTPEERLFSVRIQFVEKVLDSTLNQLLDRLLREEIITMEEMEAARIKPRAERARDVIDMVRNKGERASSFLIDALRKLDKHLFDTLGLS